MSVPRVRFWIWTLSILMLIHEQSVTVCEAQSCGPIDIPPNSFLFNTSCGNLYGASCTFGCLKGYLSASGNLTRTCLHSGQWSGNDINCTEIPGTSIPEEHDIPKKNINPVIVVVPLVVLFFITVFCLRRLYRALIGTKNIVRPIVGPTETFTWGHFQFVNPAYVDDTANIQEFNGVYKEIRELQLHNVHDVSFDNPYYGSGNHYQSLDNAHARPDNVFMGLDHIQSSQLEVADSAEAATTDFGTSREDGGSLTSAASNFKDKGSDRLSMAEEKISSDVPGGESVYCGHCDQSVTQSHCFSIKHHVGVYWKDVLRELSIDETIIRNLEEDFKYYEVDEKCYQGLLRWKNSVGPKKANTKKLCDALNAVGCSKALKTLWKQDKNMQRSSAVKDRIDAASKSACTKGGSSSLPAAEVPRDSNNQGGRTSPDSSSGESVDYSEYCSSLGSDDDPVTEGLCFDISAHVGVSWKNVLRQLGMEETIIRIVEENYKSSDVVEKCYQGLLKWKESVGPRKATIKKLCDALFRVGCSEALKTSRRENTPDNSDC